MSTKPKGFAVRIFFIIVVLILVLGVGGGTFYFTSNLKAVGNGDTEIDLTIEEGQSFDSVLENMEKLGLIRSSDIAKLYAKIKGTSSYLAGTFEMNDGMSTGEVLNYICDQDNLKHDYLTLKVSEMHWAKGIASNISELYDGKFSTEDILDAWNDIDYIQELAKDYTFLDVSALNNENYKVKLEGYLFPDTYYLNEDATIDEITRTMLDRFDVMYQERKADFESSEYSVHDIIKLASVVQFEASSVDDMKEIAGVFYNRLAQNMKLESSVTVCYALYEDSTNIQACETNTDIDSLYNTYKYEGLPVGPILNPGSDAIDAVLHPNSSEYLYFAADIYNKVDGKVHYSKTYEEHLQVCEELGLIM